MLHRRVCPAAHLLLSISRYVPEVYIAAAEIEIPDGISPLLSPMSKEYSAPDSVAQPAVNQQQQQDNPSPADAPSILVPATPDVSQSKLDVLLPESNGDSPADNTGGSSAPTQQQQRPNPAPAAAPTYACSDTSISARDVSWGMVSKANSCFYTAVAKCRVFSS